MKKASAAVLFVLVIVITSGIFSYRVLRESSVKAQELSYMGSRGWQWHNETSRLQIKYVEGDLPALRRVAKNKHYASLITIDAEGMFRGFIFFDADCEPGTIITNSYHGVTANGEKQQVLHCLHGKLVSMKTWGAAPKAIWEGKVGDYEFRVIFEDWDFTPLQKAYIKSTAELI
jgi:hypothetical protein